MNLSSKYYAMTAKSLIETYGGNMHITSAISTVHWRCHLGRSSQEETVVLLQLLIRPSVRLHLLPLFHKLRHTPRLLVSGLYKD